MNQAEEHKSDSVASHSSGVGNSIGHFKILMYSWIAVDENRLDEGIYQAAKPYLYFKDETIDSLIKNARWLDDMGYMDINLKSYEERIRKCRLVPVQVMISEQNLEGCDASKAASSTDDDNKK
jgi:hypothetical protein